MKRITATVAAMILIGGLTVVRPNGDMEVWTSHRNSSGSVTYMGIGSRDNYLGTMKRDRNGNVNVYEYINTEYERNHGRNPSMDDDMDDE